MPVFARDIFAAVVVLLVPGSAILSWLPGYAQSRRSPLARMADAAALSVAVSALLGLWLLVAGIRLNGTAVVGLYSLFGLALAARWIWKGVRVPNGRAVLAWAAALVFLALLVGWRLYQIRDLVLPAWVDSLQHTLLTRKILEWGGVPRDMQPYLPVPVYYHFSFHLIAALFAGLAGASADHAVLWFGQVLNAFAALSVFCMAEAVFARMEDVPAIRRLARRLFAAALVGFVFQMPAYYVSWGRYTLLTGLILLGPAIAAAYATWENPSDKAAWVRLGLLAGGICLTHYFVLLLLGLFEAVLGGFVLARTLRERDWSPLARMAAWNGLGIALALPWMIWVWQNAHAQAGVQVTNLFESGPEVQKRVADYFVYFASLTGPRYNHILLGIAGVGAIFALRRPVLRPLTIWALLVALFSLPWGLRVDPFRPDHFAIIFFFPAALLLADLLASGAEAVPLVVRRPDAATWLAWPIFLLAAGLILIWGVRETRGVVNPGTVIATRADVQALDWVEQNTPPTARFYINSTTWQSVYRGVDGGYWLLPYTGRGSLVPPIFYAWGRADYRAQIAGWAARAAQVDSCSPDFWSLVREANLSYVYLREGVGKLQPAGLADCPRLRKVYGQQGVFIYEILRPGGGAP